MGQFPDRKVIAIPPAAASARARRNQRQATLFAGVNLVVFGILAGSVVIAAILYQHWG